MRGKPRRTCAAGSPPGLIVEPLHVEVIFEHAERDDRKREHARAGFELSARGLLPVRKRNVRVHAAVEASSPAGRHIRPFYVRGCDGDYVLINPAEKT